MGDAWGRDPLLLALIGVPWLWHVGRRLVWAWRDNRSAMRRYEAARRALGD